ncbi:hypothetical protein CEP14_16560, partial [Cylindrospermopsis raciborskii C04]
PQTTISSRGSGTPAKKPAPQPPVNQPPQPTNLTPPPPPSNKLPDIPDFLQRRRPNPRNNE